MTPPTIQILMWDKLCKRDPVEADRLRAFHPEAAADLDKAVKEWTTA